MEIIMRETRKARKKHHCNFCGNEIQKGETYNRSINKADCSIYIGKVTRSVRNLPV